MMYYKHVMLYHTTLLHYNIDRVKDVKRKSHKQNTGNFSLLQVSGRLLST